MPTPATDVTYTAPTSAISRTAFQRIRETVSLADYWSPVDPAANLPAALAAAFTDGSLVEIPSAFGTFDIGANTLIIPEGKSLAIRARMTGTYQSQIVQQSGTSEIYFEDDGHLQDVVLKLTGGTPRVYGFAASGRANVAALLIQGASGASFRNLLIDGIDIREANYGILEQGANHCAVGTQILNGRFFDLRGDAIELNRVNDDKNIQIINHSIDRITGSQNAFWGLGIGVANANDLLIADISLSKLRQGIHVEYSNRVVVDGIVGNEITDEYSTASGIEVGGVIIYGCDQFQVANLSGAFDVRFMYGAGGGAYMKPPRNWTLRNVNLSSGDVILNAGREPGTRSYAEVDGVTLGAGQFRLDERANLQVLRNVTAQRARAQGPAVVINPYLSMDGRASYRGTEQPVTIVENINGYDEYGADSAGFRGSSGDVYDPLNPQFNPGVGRIGGVLRVHGNNWAADGGVSPFMVNRSFAKSGLGGAFPYGFEVVRGDVVTCTDTGAAWLVTQAGSRNRAGDNFIVSNQADREIRSTNFPWTNGNHHFPGQRIILSGVGAAGSDLVTTVTAVYVASNHYRMTVADTINAADGTTGTITAATQLNYVKLGEQRTAINADSSVTLTSDSAEVQLFTTPLTANRTVTLPSTTTGTLRFRIVRTAASSGTSTLEIGSPPLKSLAEGTWCEVTMVDVTNATWEVTAAGSV